MTVGNDGLKRHREEKEKTRNGNNKTISNVDERMQAHRTSIFVSRNYRL